MAPRLRFVVTSLLFALVGAGLELALLLLERPWPAPIVRRAVVETALLWLAATFAFALLQAATSAANGRGFEEMLSDVDTLNQPMIDTMRNAGHLDGVRPWHIWHYRAEVATLVEY